MHHLPLTVLFNYISDNNMVICVKEKKDTVYFLNI